MIEPLRRKERKGKKRDVFLANLAYFAASRFKIKLQQRSRPCLTEASLSEGNGQDPGYARFLVFPLLSAPGCLVPSTSRAVSHRIRRSRARLQFSM